MLLDFEFYYVNGHMKKETTTIIFFVCAKEKSMQDSDFNLFHLPVH